MLKILARSLTVNFLTDMYEFIRKRAQSSTACRRRTVLHSG